MENNETGNGPIGSTFTKYGKLLKIVEDDIYDGKDACELCYLRNGACDEFNCMSSEREDGKSVHYEEVKTK